MSNITEDYVSFETAQLLPAKGWDIDTRHFYNEGSGWKLQTDSILKTGEGEWVNAPTHQLACKWLRIKHNIHIHSGHNPNKYSAWIRVDNDLEGVCIFQTCIGYDFKSHEEAIETAIQYTLKNLVK